MYEFAKSLIYTFSSSILYMYVACIKNWIFEESSKIKHLVTLLYKMKMGKF